MNIRYLDSTLSIMVSSSPGSSTLSSVDVNTYLPGVVDVWSHDTGVLSITCVSRVVQMESYDSRVDRVFDVPSVSICNDPLVFCILTRLYSILYIAWNWLHCNIPYAITITVTRILFLFRTQISKSRCESFGNIIQRGRMAGTVQCPTNCIRYHNVIAANHSDRTLSYSCRSLFFPSSFFFLAAFKCHVTPFRSFYALTEYRLPWRT